ncbi:redoxin domain-containing protein [bacterium]|nr:redoxin domain-containing protein [bacterium]
MLLILFAIIGIFAGIQNALAEDTSGLLNAHEAKFTSIDGKPMPLSDYRGKLLLVVNTASKCGFTPQYEGLEKLYQKYKSKGLVIIGVPANNFGSQEPGSNEDIKQFAEGSFHVTFPLTQKEDVVGKGAHPFYQWAAKQAGVLGTPKWNFHKYLISPEGTLIDWFSSATKPEDEKLVKAIEANLPGDAKAEAPVENPANPDIIMRKKAK